MNKYQKALETIFEYNTDECESFDDYMECTYNNTCYIHKSYMLLQKLVNKATPKKATPFPNSSYYNICPKCKITLEFKPEYCHNCGQALDWSGEDE